MIRLLACFALWCCLLCPRASNSQPIQPLRPNVVTLDSGTVARRHLIGMVPATFDAVRRGHFIDSVLLGVRGRRIQGLLRDSVLASQGYSIQAAELRRCRAHAEAGNREFDALTVDTRTLENRRTSPPLLLDGHFWTGAGVGVAVAAVVKLLFLP